jgi:thioredoxin-like negative regulator of GroEL
MVAPILEELANEYDGEIYIYKVDTEAEQQLAAEFGIRSIPSLLFVPYGRSSADGTGSTSKRCFQAGYRRGTVEKIINSGKDGPDVF